MSTERRWLRKGRLKWHLEDPLPLDHMGKGWTLCGLRARWSERYRSPSILPRQNRCARCEDARLNKGRP